MPLTNTPRRSVISAVIEQLEAAIASGEWPVGSKIPRESQLATDLGVGRNSLREAVRALTHAGLLEARQGDGTYVRAATGLGVALERFARRAQARQVLEVRRGLEAEAARLAARRSDPEELARIATALDEQSAAATAGDRDRFIRADVGFHRAVAAAAGNPVLFELLDHLDIPTATAATVDELTAHDHPLQAHVALAAAIHDGRDGDAAAEARVLIDTLIDLLESAEDGRDVEERR